MGKATKNYIGSPPSRGVHSPSDLADRSWVFPFAVSQCLARPLSEGSTRSPRQLRWKPVQRCLTVWESADRQFSDAGVGGADGGKLGMTSASSSIRFALVRSAAVARTSSSSLSRPPIGRNGTQRDCDGKPMSPTNAPADTVSSTT